MEVAHPLVPSSSSRTRAESARSTSPRLLRERVVFVGTAIDDDIANLVVAQLLHLEAEDPEKDIQLYINSPGGVVYSAWRSTTRCASSSRRGHHRVRHRDVDGLAAAGRRREGKRSALPNSRILVHQPVGGFQGQATHIQIHAKESLALRRRMEEIYAEHTGRPVEEISEALERDRCFTPEEALDYGMIDRVTELAQRQRERERNGGCLSPHRPHRATRGRAVALRIIEGDLEVVLAVGVGRAA